jgi:hypothetical protein
MAEKSLNALVNCVNKAKMMCIAASMGKNINLDVVFYDIYRYNRANGYKKSNRKSFNMVYLIFYTLNIKQNE